MKTSAKNNLKKIIKAEVNKEQEPTLNKDSTELQKPDLEHLQEEHKESHLPQQLLKVEKTQQMNCNEETIQ